MGKDWFSSPKLSDALAASQAVLQCPGSLMPDWAAGASSGCSGPAGMLIPGRRGFPVALPALGWKPAPSTAWLFASPIPQQGESRDRQ